MCSSYILYTGPVVQEEIVATVKIVVAQKFVYLVRRRKSELVFFFPFATIAIAIRVVFFFGMQKWVTLEHAIWRKHAPLSAKSE